MSIKIKLTKEDYEKLLKKNNIHPKTNIAKVERLLAIAGIHTTEHVKEQLK